MKKIIIILTVLLAFSYTNYASSTLPIIKKIEVIKVLNKQTSKTKAVTPSICYTVWPWGFTCPDGSQIITCIDLLVYDCNTGAAIFAQSFQFDGELSDC